MIEFLTQTDLGIGILLYTLMGILVVRFVESRFDEGRFSMIAWVICVVFWFPLVLWGFLRK